MGGMSYHHEDVGAEAIVGRGSYQRSLPDQDGTELHVCLCGNVHYNNSCINIIFLFLRP